LAIQVVARETVSRIGDFGPDQRHRLGDEVSAIPHRSAPIVVREFIDIGNDPGSLDRNCWRNFSWKVLCGGGNCEKPKSSKGE
jgi:hypothetical protein